MADGEIHFLDFDGIPMLLNSYGVTLSFIEITQNVADISSPQVTNVLPVAGSILSSDDAISFDIEDETHVQNAIIYFLINGRYEVAYRGYPEGFTPQYSNSTMSYIANGLRFSVRRNDGWTGPCEIFVLGFDRGGNET